MKITQMLRYDSTLGAKKDGRTFNVLADASTGAEEKLRKTMYEDIQATASRFRKPYMVVTKKAGEQTSLMFGQYDGQALEDAMQVHLADAGNEDSGFVDWAIMDTEVPLKELYLVQAVYEQDEYMSFPDGDPASPAMYPDAAFFDEDAARDHCQFKNEALDKAEDRSCHYATYVLKLDR